MFNMYQGCAVTQLKMCLSTASSQNNGKELSLCFYQFFVLHKVDESINSIPFHQFEQKLLVNVFSFM